MTVTLTDDVRTEALFASDLQISQQPSAEVIRAAILSVPKGQWEAAHMVGMSHRLALRRIILPQAARVSVPPLSNTFISLVKDTYRIIKHFLDGDDLTQEGEPAWLGILGTD